MSNVIELDFSRRASKFAFSADVYSYDMKKFQFQVTAESISDAYDVFVWEANCQRVKIIQCIAIYKDNVHERKENQAPEKVWFQHDYRLDCLVEG